MCALQTSAIGLRNNRENAIVDAIDYQIPVTHLREARGGWRCASKTATVPKIVHLCNLLINFELTLF